MASDKVELPASPASKAQHKSAVLDVTDAETEAGSEPSMAELSAQAPQRWADAEEDPPASRGSKVAPAAPRWADADTDDDDEDFWPVAAETAVADGWSVVGKKPRKPAAQSARTAPPPSRRPQAQPRRPMPREAAPAPQSAQTAPPPSRRPQQAPAAQPRRPMPREVAPSEPAAEEPRRPAKPAARGGGGDKPEAGDKPGADGRAARRSGRGGGAGAASAPRRGSGAEHRRGGRAGPSMDPSRLQW